MGSFSPPQGAFQPDEIAILHQTFEAVWRTVVAHQSPDADYQLLRATVTNRLCAIAAEGVTDLESLRAATLRSLKF